MKPSFLYSILAVVILSAQFTVAAEQQQEMLFIQDEGLSPLRLLNWVESGKTREKPQIDYDRKAQFGKWIQFKKTPGCYDTRAQVLVRDSLIAATSTDAKPCTIEEGQWLDMYSNQNLTKDSEVQIDHMVPLKEAYIAGAYQWTRAKRCVYANFTVMKEHLISTSNFENQSKADKTPEDYIPPNKDYVCTYIKNWLSVKLIWKMSMTRSESDAIKRHIKTYNCDESEFAFDKAKVEETRQAALKLEAVCPVPRVVVVKPTLPPAPAPK